jgi:pimeloyl-ACP methyl ester carboxylesterase
MAQSPSVITQSIGGLEHTLYHWDQGSDTTVLFLHGFLDVGLGFTFVVESLKDTGWNFIALDWRGHGGSAWIPSGGYYHFIDYVRDLEDCVRQIVTEDLYVVGHSMGAMALTAWLGVTKQRVAGAILLEALGPMPEMPDHGVGRIAKWLADVGLVGQSRYFEQESAIVEKLSKLYRKVPLDRVQAIAKWATVTDQDGIRWRYDPLHRTQSPIPIPESLALRLWTSIRIPMLWIGGADSPWAGDRLEWWLGQRPNLRRQRLPNAGHMLQYERPVQVGQCIQSFIEQLSK